MTSTFFAQSVTDPWKPTPDDKKKGTKYEGHDVCFLTIKGGNRPKANLFFKQLIDKGYAVDLKAVGDNPSLVVDISASK